MALTREQERMKPIIDFQTGYVKNLSDILDLIKQENDEEFLQDYLDNLTEYKASQKFKMDDISYKALFLNLTNRLEEIKKEKASNKNVLENLKKTNPNLNGLSVVETKKQDNDIYRDIEYIKYVDEQGNVTLLECASENTINSFIASHPDLATKGTGKDIFDYFKNNVHLEVKMETEKEREKTKAKEDFNDKEVLEVEELSKVKEYATNKKIVGEPKIGEDTHGERIYIVGTSIIKFKTDDNGKRELYVISDEDYENNYEAKETDVKKESIDTVSYEANNTDLGIEIIKLNEFIELVSRAYNGDNLTEEEQEKMHNFVLASITDMENGSLDYDTQNAIDCYMEYLREQEKDNTTKKTDELLEKYYLIIEEKNKEQLQKENEAKAAGQIKVLEIKPVDHHGNIITIVVIEITLLLGMLVSILAFAIK